MEAAENPRRDHELPIHDPKRKHRLLDTAPKQDEGNCVGLMKQSVNEMGLSARAHDKVLRLARTIADLDSAEQIRFEHLSEAINYRQLDREIWS